jgi:glycosyltransferase involved in cell wall biosynthesis
MIFEDSGRLRARSSEDSVCRVGFIVPSMHCGGAERWTLSLAEHCGRFPITWTGCVVTQGWRDATMVTKLSQIMPVHQLGVTTFGSREHRVSLGDAVSALVADSDLIVVWEVDEVIDRFVEDISIHVVHVSHRESTIEPRFVRKSHHVAAVSEGCALSFGPERASTARIIPNGVDLRRCATVRTRDEMRRLWGCTNDTLVVGYIGRIDAAKNCQALSRAVRGLGPDTMGVCYGPEAFGGREWIAELHRTSGNRVQAFSPVEDVGSVLRAIDVFLLPSRTEGHSMALLEAWAAGVPVVATKVGALPELESTFGALCVPIGPDDSAELLASAIRKVASEMPEMCEIRARAQRMVLSHFRVDQMAAAWSAYLGCLDALVPEKI